LCATRITAHVAHVGKSLKCPDCGRKNVIPPPAVVVPPKTPAAMSGEQFDIWGVDEAPSPAELRAHSPTLHPVVCGLCQTLMYATDAQVGTKLKCPDCGTLTIARARVPERPRGPVTVPDGDEYQLDEASAPTPRPVYRPFELRGAKDDWEPEVGGDDRASRGDAATAVRPPGEAGSRDDRPDRRRLGERETEVRPKLPAVPLVQGALRMVFTIEVLVRWVALSIALTVAGWFFSWIFNAMSNMVYFALPMFAIGCVFTAVWMISALPVMLAIVTESSEGNDRLHDPPNPLALDFAEAFFVAIAAAMSVFPAWLTLQIPTNWPAEAHAALAVGAWLLFFPVVLLSNLEQSSAFAVFSPRLVASVFRCAGPWLLFYFESAVLAAAAGAAVYGIAQGPAGLMYLLPWLAVGTLLIYMRLLGRLAWWLAETMPAVEEAERE
jgi:predicted RNA-binding Zn-ribbon protein involved in translation (DUF1610 family)